MASWIIAFISSTGYIGILLLMLIENVFPPIPSELIMPLAGFMVAQEKLTFLGTVLAGMAGSVLGALPFYYAGKKLGEERVKRFADQYGRWLTLSRQDIERASRWFHKHGSAAVMLWPPYPRRAFPHFGSRWNCRNELREVSLLYVLRNCSLGGVADLSRVYA